MGVRAAPPSIGSVSPRDINLQRTRSRARTPRHSPLPVPFPASTASRSQASSTRGASAWITNLGIRAVFTSLIGAVDGLRGETAPSEPVESAPPPNGFDWKIPSEESDSFAGIHLSDVASDGWKSTFADLEKLDKAREKEYREAFDSLLLFAGLFSAVVTAFVVGTLAPLQDSSSQAMADALRHISLQLHDSAISPLPLRDSTRPSPISIRVNVLWLISLVMSLMAALLAILVKQWMQAYMSWTSLMPGKNAVALRQYRMRGWRKGHVHLWHDAIPLLLQLALILFLCGLVDLLWHTQETIASIVSGAVGVAFTGLLGATLWPSWDPQCAYRSPLSSLLRRALSWMYDVMRLGVKLLQVVIPGRLKGSARKSFRASLKAFNQRPSNASWDFHDLALMDDPLEAHPHAVEAASEVVASFPSHSVLETVTAGLFDRIDDSPWMPIQNLWPVLRGLLGDDDVSQKAAITVVVNSKPDELNLAGGQLSVRFCQVVATLVRRAALHQRNCSPEDIHFVQYAVDVASVLARAKPTVLPYQATTLALLIRQEFSIPQAIVQAAERQLLQYKKALDKSPNTLTSSQWQPSNIIAFFEATTALLDEGLDLSRILDTVIIALRLATDRRHLSEDVSTALQELLESLAVVLRPGPDIIASPQDLRRDLCVVLVQLLETRHSPDIDASVIPHGLAWTVAVRLGYTHLGTDSPPNLESWDDLTMDDAHRVADIIRAGAQLPPRSTAPLEPDYPGLGTHRKNRPRTAKIPSKGARTLRAIRHGANATRPPIIQAHAHTSPLPMDRRGTSSSMP